MKTQVMLFDAEVVETNEGSLVRPRKLIADCSVAQAKKYLKCSNKTVHRLWREGKIAGFKPRGYTQRRDRKRSNSKLVLDMQSVIDHRKRMVADGLLEL